MALVVVRAPFEDARCQVEINRTRWSCPPSLNRNSTGRRCAVQGDVRPKVIFFRGVLPDDRYLSQGVPAKAVLSYLVRFSLSVCNYIEVISRVA
jgi:hypothetical protein